MRRSVLCGLVVACVLAGSSAASAQQPPAPPPAYLFGGWTLSPSTPMTHGPVVGFGFGLTSEVSLEFSGARRTGTPHTWALGSLGVTYSRYETIRRDVPFTIALRFRSSSDTGPKTAFLLGGVLNSRGETDYVIAQCSTATGVCSSRPRAEAGGESWVEPGFVVGAEVQVAIGGRFEVGPSFRLFGLRRLPCGTQGRACVSRPETPGWVQVEIGIKAAWLLK